MTSVDTRPFGFWMATALVMGGMIGSGIFLLPSALAPYGWLGPVAWVISISGALAIGHAISRLGRTMPEQTGAIALSGAVLGPLAGVFIGWSYWISCWATVAAVAIAATSYISVFVPALAATPLAGSLFTVAMIWAMTLLNLGGARDVGRFQIVTTVIKLVPLVAAIALIALIFGQGRSLLPAAPPPFAGGALAGLTAAVTLTLFPLLGFELACVAAERVRDPVRTIARATLTATAVVGGLYLIVCTGIVAALPTATLAASSSPFQLFVETYWGRGPALATSAFAAIAAIGALNAFVLMQGEVPLGMARAGLLPSWFARVNGRDVPVRVQLLSSALASGLILSDSSPSLGGIFEFVVLVTTSSSLWLYAAVCVAALLRKVAMPAAAIGLPFSIWAMIGAGVQASALAFVLMVTALPLYVLRGRGAK